MRLTRSTARLLAAVLAVGAAGELLVGCASLPLPWSTAGLPRLYISDTTIRVRGDSFIADNPDIDLTITNLQKRGDLGVFITNNAVYTVDPIILVQTTSHRTIPPEELTSEPEFGVDGSQGTDRQVLRNPLFFIDRAVIKYKVPGYTVPDLELNLNTAMKATSIVIDKLPLSYAEPIVRALYNNPTTTPAAAGKMEVIIEARDMDPLLSESARRVTASREYQVLYSRGSIILGEAEANTSPLSAPNPTFSVAPAQP